MKLILIRHAKSGWDDPMADDHDRTLTDRGRKASTRIGQWLMEKGHVPTHIYASDAMRAQQTAQGIMAVLRPAPLLSLHPTLYHASPDTIADLVEKQPQETLAIVGHNPGIGMLAHGLVAARPTHHRFSDYPTCATTVIELRAPIAPGAGTCIDFVVPRDLTDEGPHISARP